MVDEIPLTFIAMADWDYHRVDNGAIVFGNEDWDDYVDMVGDYWEETPGQGYHTRYYEGYLHRTLGYIVCVFHLLDDYDTVVSMTTDPYQPPHPVNGGVGRWSALQAGHAGTVEKAMSQYQAETQLYQAHTLQSEYDEPLDRQLWETVKESGGTVASKPLGNAALGWVSGAARDANLNGFWYQRSMKYVHYRGFANPAYEVRENQPWAISGYEHLRQNVDVAPVPGSHWWYSPVYMMYEDENATILSATLILEDYQAQAVLNTDPQNELSYPVEMVMGLMFDFEMTGPSGENRDPRSVWKLPSDDMTWTITFEDQSSGTDPTAIVDTQLSVGDTYSVQDGSSAALKTIHLNLWHLKELFQNAIEDGNLDEGELLTVPISGFLDPQYVGVPDPDLPPPEGLEPPIPPFGGWGASIFGSFSNNLGILVAKVKFRVEAVTPTWRYWRPINPPVPVDALVAVPSATPLPTFFV